MKIIASKEKERNAVEERLNNAKTLEELKEQERAYEPKRRR